MTIVVCGPGWNGEPPNELLASEPIVERWCFAERKRLPHTWELWGSREPSWWEPVWICRCSGCGKDRTTFGDGW